MKKKERKAKKEKKGINIEIPDKLNNKEDYRGYPTNFY